MMPTSVTGNKPTVQRDWQAHPARAHSRGFTLLEMLAVIVLLALSVTAISMSTGHSIANARAEKACRGTALLLRAARALALSTGTSQSVRIDTTNRLIVDAAGQPHALPADLQISMQGASQLMQGGRGAIAFGADGSSSGGHVSLQHDGNICRIDVSWLTGSTDVRQKRLTAGGN